MQAGIVYGYIGQVDYYIVCHEEGTKCTNAKVIATGGLAELIAKILKQ